MGGRVTSKYLLYANLKKYWSYQEEVKFLGYIISH